MITIWSVGETEVGSVGAQPTRDSQWVFDGNIQIENGDYLMSLHFADPISGDSPNTSKNSSCLVGNSAYQKPPFVRFPLNQHTMTCRYYNGCALYPRPFLSAPPPMMNAVHYCHTALMLPGWK